LGEGLQVSKWQQLDGGITPDEAVLACVQILNAFFNSDGCEVTGMVIGQCGFFFTETIGNGWLVADGAEVSRTEYAELFTAIGVMFGSGDGTTTFNLPDMSGRSPMATGTPYVGADTIGLGATFGEQSHELTSDENGLHSHGGVWVNGGTNRAVVSSGGAQLVSIGDTQSDGLGLAHNNLHPSMGLVCCIYTGIIAP
jgi:microcystin-dependent protein